jgi:putative oxidoreductase
MTVGVQLSRMAGRFMAWAAMALAIMAWGPGRISVDHWLLRGNA